MADWLKPRRAPADTSPAATTAAAATTALPHPPARITPTPLRVAPRPAPAGDESGAEWLPRKKPKPAPPSPPRAQGCPAEEDDWLNGDACAEDCCDEEEDAPEPLPFAGVGLPFRDAAKAPAARGVVQDFRGRCVLALPGSGGERAKWFSGHAADAARQFQLSAREASEDPCDCAVDTRRFRVTLADGRGRGAALVDAAGGDLLRLKPLDAAELAFDCEKLVAGPAADALLSAYFPKLAATAAAAVARGEDFDVVVNVGTLSFRHLVLFDEVPSS